MFSRSDLFFLWRPGTANLLRKPPPWEKTSCQKWCKKCDNIKGTGRSTLRLRNLIPRPRKGHTGTREAILRHLFIFLFLIYLFNYIVKYFILFCFPAPEKGTPAPQRQSCASFSRELLMLVKDRWSGIAAMVGSYFYININGNGMDGTMRNVINTYSEENPNIWNSCANSTTGARR